MKLKKFFLIVAISAPLYLTSISASCSLNVLDNIKNQSLERRQKLITRYNSTKKDDPFTNNASASYGSYKSADIGGNFWRYKRMGETKVIDYIVDVKDKNKKSWKASSELILRPTFEWYNLELIKEIIITKLNGEQVLYTNSKHEKMPTKEEIQKWDKMAKEGKHKLAIEEIKNLYKWDGKSVSLKLTSNDPQSINHPDFLKNMKGASKISLIPRDVYYSDYLGNKTKYKLKAEDFYYSWLNTQLLSFHYRMENGGISLGEGKAKVDAIGEKIKIVLNDPNIKMFRPDQIFPNAYLFELFNINLEWMSKKEKTIEAIKGSSMQEEMAFTLHAKNKEIGGDFHNLFFTFINDSTFSPLPYEYIQDQNDKDHYDGKLSLKELIQDKESLSWKLGFYWYGKSLENVLYIGPYIPKKYDQFTQKKIYFQNPNFWDQQWVKSPNNIKIIQNEYKTFPLSPREFASEQLNAYKVGLIDLISFVDLPESTREELISGVPGMPIVYSKSENKNKTIFNLIETQAPDPWYLSNIKDINDKRPEIQNKILSEIDKFYFNDQYSKIMYGLTRKELSLNNKTNVSTFPHILKYAKSFRSIYMNSVNMYALVDYISLGLDQPLLPGMAPDSVFKSDTSLTIRDKLEELNSTFVFDKNGKKHTFVDGKNIINADYSFMNKVGSLERLKSKYYTELQQLMKELLDEIYQKNNWSTKEKVSWNHVYRYSNPDAKMKEMIRNFEKLVNNLDSRLDFKISVPSDYSELKNAIILHKGTKSYGSWGYDYEGIGQYYGALSSFTASPLVMLLSSILMEESKGNNIYKTELPHLYKLAKKMESLVRHEPQKNSKNAHKILYLPYKLKYISTATNFQVLHENIDFSFTKLVNGELKKLDEKDQQDLMQINKLKEYGIESFRTQSNKFFLYVQEEYSIEEHIALIQEISSIYGWDFGQQLQVSKAFNKFVKNPKFITPSGSSSISYNQDIKLLEQKEIV
ncbi:OppA family ABC transporter substrate-binding lipoprotein [Mycoplasma phocimorsus]|uniref:OppA family ABC transporter substrate-binding lipoprotein n=1 Tax=Mycoplasma phocimorsus TaxID=3045839 RepID=UPI0024BFBD77|nr:hypothetical protein [Mycoplasma phocimorsus]MDJ1647092.1 hypothetical protein [Mycoplasma phocimorsus]